VGIAGHVVVNNAGLRSIVARFNLPVSNSEANQTKTR
jgi:hypothetical protein